MISLFARLILFSLGSIFVSSERFQHNRQSSTNKHVFDQSRSLLSLFDHLLHLNEECNLALVLAGLDNAAVFQEAPPSIPHGFNLLHFEFMPYLLEPSALTLQDSFDAMENLS